MPDGGRPEHSGTRPSLSQGDSAAGPQPWVEEPRAEARPDQRGGRASRARAADPGTAPIPAPRPQTRRRRSAWTPADRPPRASAIRDGSAPRSGRSRCRDDPSCTSRPDRSPSARASQTSAGRASIVTGHRGATPAAGRELGTRYGGSTSSSEAPHRSRRGRSRERRRRPRRRAPQRPGVHGSWPSRLTAALAVRPNELAPWA